MDNRKVGDLLETRVALSEPITLSWAALGPSYTLGDFLSILRLGSYIFPTPGYDVALGIFPTVSC